MLSVTLKQLEDVAQTGSLSRYLICLFSRLLPSYFQRLLLPWRIRRSHRRNGGHLRFLPSNHDNSVFILDAYTIVKIRPELDAKREAAAMRLAQRLRSVPTPRLFAAVAFKSLPEVGLKAGVALIMERLPGRTLLQLLGDAVQQDLTALCKDLQDAVHAIHSAAQPRNLPHPICAVDGGPWHLEAFECLYSPPSFASAAALHDWLLANVLDWQPFSVKRPLTDEDRQVFADLRANFGHLRQSFDDTSRIVFTHGDLQAKNILVDKGRLSGIVDWQEAAFLPEWWDWVVAKRGAGYLGLESGMYEVVEASMKRYEEEEKAVFELAILMGVWIL